MPPCPTLMTSCAPPIEILPLLLQPCAASGIDLGDEDPLPIPEHAPPPVTGAELQRHIIEDLNLRLSAPDRPVTLDPAKASRDPTDWAALVTYGHPRLHAELERVAAGFDPDCSPAVFAEEGAVVEAVRADRSPPEPVRTLQDLEGLGQPYARGEAEEAARRRAQAGLRTP